MELTLDQALQKGIEAHKAGKAQEADRYYTAILKANSRHPDANHNMGVLAVGVGKVQEALPFFKAALEVNQTIAQFWLSYIDALVKLGRIADAKAAFDQAKGNGAKGDKFDQIEKRFRSTNIQEPPQEQQQSLINLYTQGHYQEALTQASQLLIKFPNSINLYNIIGATNQILGKLEEAFAAYNKALSIKPDYSEAYYNIGNVLQDQDKFEEAVEAYNKALSIKPDYAEAFNNMGNALKEQGRFEEATEAYTKALSIKHDSPEIHNNMGNTLIEQGNLKEAIEAFNKAISIKPNYAHACFNMGNALTEQGNLEEAIEAYSKALSIKPDYTEAYNNLGNALKDQGKLDEAKEAYKKALSIKPDYAEAYHNMGNAFKDQGKQEEAVEAYKKALSIKPDFSEVHLNLSSLKKYVNKDLQFKQVENLLNYKEITDDARCNLNFALAKMYDDLGELDKSLRHLSTGNSLRKKLLVYTINQDQDLFIKLKITQPYLLKNSLDIKKSSNELKPVFILGMPRSGTTLIEQIISSHSEVTGAGELNYASQFGFKLTHDPAAVNTAAILEFRNKYLSELSKLSNGKQLVTDKMPQNFCSIPLICAAFPEAKIVHVQRNAAATCWSNYRQYFTFNGLGFSYDLEDLAAYYKLYKDLMKFWQPNYSARIYNLNYESLVNDQENQTRKLINHLGLNWQDACLSPQKNKRSVRSASQQQVRQKVYKGSSEAWRKYEPFLNGAFDGLPAS